MVVKVNRVEPSDLGTLGTMAIDGKFVGYTLEDRERAIKVFGDTCIPKGSYKVSLRTEGGMTTKYMDKFGSFHRGMLWLADVPGFEWVYIHIGNYVSDTEGCILVGSRWTTGGVPFVGNSTAAYKTIYDLMATAIENGDEVTVEVT